MSIPRDFADSNHNALNGFRIVGKIAIKNDLENSKGIIVENLSKFSENFIENEQGENLFFVQDTLEEFFLLAVKNEQKETVENIVTKLNLINRCLSQNTLQSNLQQNMILLKQICLCSIEKRWHSASEKGIKGFHNFTKTIVEQNNLLLVDQVTGHLIDIGVSAS